MHGTLLNFYPSCLVNLCVPSMQREVLGLQITQNIKNKGAVPAVMGVADGQVCICSRPAEK